MKIEVLDSTLRDGAQGEGINYVLTDKLAIYKILASLGFDFIEAGIPLSNVTDDNLFRQLKADNNVTILKSHAVAFASTLRYGNTVENDSSLQSAIISGAEYISLVGKASTKQVSNILKISKDDNLLLIRESIEYLKSHNKSVIFDSEHFFDGYVEDKNYALSVVECAIASGASRIVLCDTNGGTLPDDIYTITKEIVKIVASRAIVGIHCHNDIGCADANTILAVKAGATHIQGTMIGYGERCGNANLSTVISILQLKLHYEVISKQSMSSFTRTALAISDISNTNLPNNMPFVGQSAFAHKAGIHIDGIIKDSTGYETILPELVGNTRRMLISQMSGRGAIVDKLNNFFPNVIFTKELVDQIALFLKQKESEGYIYESAEASFIIGIEKIIGIYSPLFELINYKVIIEYPRVDDASSTATIKVKVDSRTNITAGQGNGPVNAMDVALRQSLIPFYPYIEKVSLVDYKVRVINPEDTTRAYVRVLITSTDGDNTWSTVGVSTDIIEASWSALRDSLEYANHNFS